jgi:hypothetical protein
LSGYQNAVAAFRLNLPNNQCAKRTQLLTGMNMKIELEWEGPITLKPVNTGGYKFEAIEEELPTHAGIYVFARKFGPSFYPIYIGKAGNVRTRLKTQFKSLPLMVKVKNWNQTNAEDESRALNGTRVLFIGSLAKPNSVVQVKKALGIAERSLIEHALTEGHNIVNIQMTKTKYDEVTSSGVKGHRSFAPQSMLAKAQKKKPKKPPVKIA